MRKKKLVRHFYIGIIGFFVFVIVFGSGMFFVFGEDTVDIIGLRDFEKSSEGDDNLGDLDIDEEESSGISSSGGGGGSSEGGGSGGGSSGFVCSDWRQLQYSLGNFYENIECLVYGVGTCDKVRAVCGSELFNLDYEVGGVFGTRFSLFSGGSEVSFEVIEESVAARGRVTLRSEMILDGSFDVGSLGCVVDMDYLPMKCFG